MDRLLPSRCCGSTTTVRRSASCKHNRLERAGRKSRLKRRFGECKHQGAGQTARSQYDGCDRLTLPPAKGALDRFFIFSSW